jgi:glycosyltransferase involved in cell wall biosynthesis
VVSCARQKMKLIHIVDTMDVDGLERQVYQLFVRLHDRYDMALWCLYEGGYFADEIQRLGVEVYILPKYNWYNPLRLLWLAREMRRWKVQIIHSHGYNANLFSRVASTIAGIPIHITHLHSAHWLPSERGKRNILIDKLLSLRTSRIITCSDAVRDYTIDEGISPHRVTTIYNSVDLEAFKTDVDIVAKRRTFGFDMSDFVVGTVARLAPIKGHEYLLQAARQVIAQNPEAKFLIVGDGPCRPELEKLARELRIDAHVVFTGIRTDIPEILACVDLFVLPSSVREGLSLAIAEAMAAGRPTIGTRIGGIPEIIRDGETGFIVPPKDPDAITEKILYFLHHPEIAQNFGEAGRRWCEREYDSELMAERFNQLYQSMAYHTILRKI